MKYEGEITMLDLKKWVEENKPEEIELSRSAMKEYEELLKLGMRFFFHTITNEPIGNITFQGIPVKKTEKS